jgi:hypothetical protein
MLPAGPHVRKPEQAAVVEDRPFALGHRVELAGEVGQLAEVEARDSLVAVGQIVVRRAVVVFSRRPRNG